MDCASVWEHLIPRAREPRPIVNSGEAGLLEEAGAGVVEKEPDAGGERERTDGERVTEGIFLGQEFLTVLTSTMKRFVRFF